MDKELQFSNESCFEFLEKLDDFLQNSLYTNYEIFVSLIAQVGEWGLNCNLTTEQIQLTLDLFLDEYKKQTETSNDESK